MGAGLAGHVAGEQVAVEDVPHGGHEAAAVTRAAGCVRVHLQVPLAVGFGGEGRQADQTREGPLAWDTRTGTDTQTHACAHTGTQKQTHRENVNNLHELSLKQLMET